MYRNNINLDLKPVTLYNIFCKHSLVHKLTGTSSSTLTDEYKYITILKILHHTKGI
jgi:hypothetical protein